MPHDKNGQPLQEGDEVILRCKVTNVSPGVETACNVTAEAIERPSGEGYVPQITGNSKFYEKTAPIEPKPTIPDLEKNFTYHAPKPGQPEKYQRLREKAKELAYVIDELCPKSRERSVAMTELETAIFWANAAIARNE